MPTSPARRPTAAPNRAESTRDLSRPLPAALSWGVLVAFAGAFTIAFVVLTLPWWMPALYVVMSIIAFAAYGLDKSAARRGAQRTSERALLTLGFACGWPGALIAQQLFRHKTRKRSFRRAFWTTVVLNILALCALVALATLRGWDLEPDWLSYLPWYPGR